MIEAGSGTACVTVTIELPPSTAERSILNGDPSRSVAERVELADRSTVKAWSGIKDVKGTSSSRNSEPKILTWLANAWKLLPMLPPLMLTSDTSDIKLSPILPLTRLTSTPKRTAKSFPILPPLTLISTASVALETSPILPPACKLTCLKFGKGGLM